MLRALILTALSKEYKAVLRYLKNVSPRSTEGGTQYEVGRFEGKAAAWEVALAETGMGNTRAGVQASFLLSDWRPDLMIFVGIAGGVHDVALGDVVAADQVFYYELAKVRGGNDTTTRVETYRTAHNLVECAKSVSKRESWKHRVAGTDASQAKVHVAPIAAGEKVVASTDSTIYQWLRANLEKVVAVDMEDYGALAAAYMSGGVPTLVVRSISDLLSGKSEADRKGSQEVASERAAAFALEVLSELEARLLRVALMDSWLPNCIYDEADRALGRTNADTIRDNLKEHINCHFMKEATNLDWDGEEQVARFDPDLIIIHMSCFTGRRIPETKKKLYAFLKHLSKSTRSKFLVYTRECAPEDPEEIRQLSNELESIVTDDQWIGRTVLFRIPLGRQTFKDKGTVADLRQHTMNMLGLL
jgi:nucleoside phosphorylase